MPGDEREREGAVDERPARTACAPRTASLKCDLVRVHRQAREPDVVGLGDRAAEPAAVDVSDVEVLEEPAPPVLRRRTGVRSIVISFWSPRAAAAPVRRPAGRSSLRRAPRRHGLRRRALDRPRPPLRPLELLLARCEGVVHHRHLGGVDTRLAAEADERASRHSSSSPASPADIEMDDVERRRADLPQPSRARPSSGHRGSRARPSEARGRARRRGRRRRAWSAATRRCEAISSLPHTLAVSTIAITAAPRRRASPPPRARLGQDDGVGGGGEPPVVAWNSGVPTRVDPDEPRRPAGGREDVATSARAASFRAGATASSRSATTASAAEPSAFASLRSSLPGAKRRERTMGELHDLASGMSDIRQCVKLDSLDRPRSQT